MKKIAIAVGILVVLVIAAAVAIPMLVPVSRIQSELVARVKAATGRDLAFGGKTSFSVLPNFALSAENVTLSNPAGYAGPQMAQIGSLDVKLKLLPLIHGGVEIESFILDKPVIGLEVDKQGRPNWSFAQQAAAGTTPPGATPATAAAPATQQTSSSSGLSDIQLGDVKITNGSFSYKDDRTGETETIDQANLAVSLASLDSTLKVNGNLVWRGKKVSATLAVARPRAILTTGDTDASATLSSDPVKFSYEGKVTGGNVLKAAGTVQLDSPSVRDLVQWTTGSPLTAPGTGFGPLSIKGQLAFTPGNIGFNQATLSFDQIKATGSITLVTTGKVPALKGQLDVTDLNINPYLPPKDKGKSASANGGAGSGTAKTESAAQAGWSSDPIDTSMLKVANLDLTLSTGSIEMRDIKIGKSALHLTLADAKLNADLTQLALYSGAGTGQVTLDGSGQGGAQGGAGQGLGVAATASLKGVQLEPLLADAADFSKLSGTGNADFAVQGRGTSEAAIVASLGGKCALDVKNGAIKGIDVGSMIKNIGSSFTGGGSSSQQTAFSTMAGTCTIASGVLTNRDLTLQSPVVRVAGAGTSDLARRTVDYRIEPRLEASVPGAKGMDLGGVSVPVLISGTWSNLSYKPDLAGAAKGLVQGLGKGVAGGTSSVGQALGGVLGNKTQGTGSSSGLKLPNLFGNK